VFFLVPFVLFPKAVAEMKTCGPATEVVLKSREVTGKSSQGNKKAEIRGIS
jgi:hypothetical protein